MNKEITSIVVTPFAIIMDSVPCRGKVVDNPNKSTDKRVILQYLQNLGNPHDESKVNNTLFTLIEKNQTRGEHVELT